MNCTQRMGSASYFAHTGCKHALSGEHILRELQGLIDEGNQWAQLMHNYLMELYVKSDKGKGKIDDFATFSLRYDEICRIADVEEPKSPPKLKKCRGKPKQTKGRYILDRLVKHKPAVLAFAQYAEVPFTNN